MKHRNPCFLISLQIRRKMTSERYPDSIWKNPQKSQNGTPSPISYRGAVWVLDEDSVSGVSMKKMLRSNGFDAEHFRHPDQIFGLAKPRGPVCLIADVHCNGGMCGIDVHQAVHAKGWHVSSLFLTASHDVPAAVAAMRAGAEGVLVKPCDTGELLKELKDIFVRARARYEVDSTAKRAKNLASGLTQREGQIVKLVVSGLLNKEIADELGLALVTVKVHRGRAMKKLGAGNAAELARIAALAGIA